jgi:hypothetical protein
LAETLAQRKSNRYLGLINRDFNTLTGWKFMTLQRVFLTPRYPAVMMGPASPHQLEGIAGKLSRILEEEQPSAGWIWFSYKYNIPSCGLGPEIWFCNQGNMHAPGAENELIWGYPFWGVERLVELGVEIPWAAGSLQASVRAAA